MNKSYDEFYEDELHENLINETINPTIFNNFVSMIIFGKPRSGKTCFLKHIYQKYLRKRFQMVFVFARNNDTIEDYKQMESEAITQKFSSDIKESREMFSSLYVSIENDPEISQKKKLIIIDDYYDDNIAKNCGIIDFFLSGRHEKVSTIFICQYTKVMVKPIMKSSADIIALFKTGGDDANNMKNIIFNVLVQKFPEEKEKTLSNLANRIFIDTIMNKKLKFNGIVIRDEEIYNYIPKIKKSYS